VLNRKSCAFFKKKPNKQQTKGYTYR